MVGSGNGLRTLACTSLAALGLLAGGAPAAHGSIAIGQLDPGTPGGDCQGGTMWVQAVEAAGAPYAVPAGSWVVVSWSHRADLSSGRELGLRVWRPTPTSGTYTLAGAGPLRVLTPGGINSFQERIPVAGGDRLGLRVGGAGGPSCTFTTGSATDAVRHSTASDPPQGSNAVLSSKSTSRRLNLAARLEPDADADWFGDETQDGCPGTAGPASGCPTGTAGPPDSTRPRARLRVRRDAIRDGHVGLWVTASEAVRLTARGSVKVRRRGRRHRLRPAVAKGAAHRTVRLSLRMRKVTKRAARQALRRGRRLRARISVTLRDAAGNRTVARATVRLKL